MVGANLILFTPWSEFTGGCNLILLDENYQTNCEEVWNICKYGTTPAATETGTTQKGTLITAHETESATERETPHITHTETLSTGTESTTTSVAPSLEPGQEPAGPGPTPSALPSWSLKWCPRRIQGNPNRHFCTFTFGYICFEIFFTG